MNIENIETSINNSFFNTLHTIEYKMIDKRLDRIIEFIDPMNPEDIKKRTFVITQHGLDMAVYRMRASMKHHVGSRAWHVNEETNEVYCLFTVRDEKFDQIMRGKRYTTAYHDEFVRRVIEHLERHDFLYLASEVTNEFIYGENIEYGLEKARKYRKLLDANDLAGLEARDQTFFISHSDYLR